MSSFFFSSCTNNSGRVTLVVVSTRTHSHVSVCRDTVGIKVGIVRAWVDMLTTTGMGSIGFTDAGTNRTSGRRSTVGAAVATHDDDVVVC